MNVSFSIVIPNYNGSSLLEKNLPLTFAAADATKLPYEIIIPDDASTDNSIQFIEEQYPQITLIKNKVNKGFSININSGIMASKNSWVLLLNSDVGLHPAYLCQLMQHLHLPNLFGVMGGIYDFNTKKLVDAAKFPAITFGNINGTINFKDKDQQQLLPSLFLSGANALVNRELLLQLGGFDTIFSPYYFEDVDLGLRAWRSGYSCFYDPKAICWHATSSTIKHHQPSNKVQQMIYKNKLLLHAIHLQSLSLFIFNIKLILKCSIAFLRNNTIEKAALELFNENKNEIVNRRLAMEQKNYKTIKKIKSIIFKKIGKGDFEKF
jgi:GT2 family glycosyltransferase